MGLLHLPAGQTIVFSLESFERFLSFPFSHEFNCGCDINDTSNRILINLLIEDETEENILLIEKDRTEILIDREIRKINTKLLYGIL